MKFECKRCGKCCQFTQNGTLPRDFWKKAELSEEEIKQLQTERAKHPRNDVGCEMLVMQDGIGSCLIHSLFGIEKKPKICVDFPSFSPQTFCYEYLKKQVKELSIEDNFLLVEAADGTVKRVELSEAE